MQVQTYHAPIEKIDNDFFSRCSRMAGVIQILPRGRRFHVLALRFDRLAAVAGQRWKHLQRGRSRTLAAGYFNWVLDIDFCGQRRTVTARTQAICWTRSVVFGAHTSPFY